MTTRNQNSLHFGKLGKGRGWKDLFVVTFLVVVLGAFVAQISSSPTKAPAHSPVAAAASATTAHG
jgi:hypothetical protein